MGEPAPSSAPRACMSVTSAGKFEIQLCSPGLSSKVRLRRDNVILYTMSYSLIILVAFGKLENFKIKSIIKLKLERVGPSFMYDEIFDVQQHDCRVQEASSDLVGCSETAPHISPTFCKVVRQMLDNQPKNIQ